MGCGPGGIWIFFCVLYPIPSSASEVLLDTYVLPVNVYGGAFVA
jgi:hypothetical protein